MNAALPDCLPMTRMRVPSVRGIPERASVHMAHAERPVADVFWVHPTLEHGGEFSNRLLSDPKKLAWTLGQAAAFSGAAAVWAPHYRQLVLGSDGLPAIYREASALAHGDVRLAFLAFLSQSQSRLGADRPFFLAGHSQGAGHVCRLLHEFFVGDGDAAARLRRRLVGVYPIGCSVPPPVLGTGAALRGLGVDVCTGAAQPGTLATWQTVTEDAGLADSLTGRLAPKLGISEPLAVNPLSWRADSVECDAAACGLSSLGRWALTGERVLYEGIVGATVCRGGLLRVLRVNDAYMRHYRTAPERPKDYHSMDVHLFWGPLRENAEAQLAAWLSTQ